MFTESFYCMRNYNSDYTKHRTWHGNNILNKHQRNKQCGHRTQDPAKLISHMSLFYADSASENTIKEVNENSEVALMVQPALSLLGKFYGLFDQHRSLDFARTYKLTEKDGSVVENIVKRMLQKRFKKRQQTKSHYLEQFRASFN